MARSEIDVELTLRLTVRLMPEDPNAVPVAPNWVVPPAWATASPIEVSGRTAKTSGTRRPHPKRRPGSAAPSRTGDPARTGQGRYGGWPRRSRRECLRPGRAWNSGWVMVPSGATMKSPLNSGLRHTTMRTESPGARTTCSGGSGEPAPCAAALLEKTRNASNGGRDRRSRFRIDLSRSRRLTDPQTGPAQFRYSGRRGRTIYAFMGHGYWPSGGPERKAMYQHCF